MKTKNFKLSAFKPTSAVALKTGLFHSPETVTLLRGEAVDRFLRWREVERAFGEIESSRKRKRDWEQEGWTKAQWEMEWMENHSLHVARRMREGTITQRAVERTRTLDEHFHEDPKMYDSISFDPLHLPSLVFLSFSLFAPLKSRVRQSVRRLWGDFSWQLSSMQMAIVGGVGFCLGLGVGLFTR